MTGPFQVVLDARGPVVAGLPCAVRAAFRAGRELSPERVVLRGADPRFLRRWAFPLRASGARIASEPDPGLPTLGVAADAFPDEGALPRFLAAARGGGARVAGGRPVAWFAPGPAVPPASLPRVEAGEFFDCAGPDAAKAAARALYARLAKDNDGYIAKFDRTLSIALTRLMLPFPISPNMVTAASLLIGLYGAFLLAAPSAGLQLAGAAILWFCCLLDGCDGEIARLKHHSTPWGGEFDLWADHVAHLATFVALPVGVARLHPGRDWTVPGVLLVSGFLAAGYAVWALVLRVPEEKRGRLGLIVERVASRDYVYLILLLAALGRLDLFVWAAAIGSHVFWLALAALSRRAPTRAA